MPRFGVKEVADVTFYNLLTGKPELFLDTLKLSNLENGAESVYANGGSGSPRLVGWDFNRTATFNVQDALLNPKAISMQVGNDLKNQIETVYKREVLVSVAGVTAGTTEVDLAQSPNAGSVTAHITSDGYEHGTEVVPTTVGDPLVFSDVDLPVGETVIVYYTYDTTADAEIITISSDKFGGYYKAVGDTLWRNEKTGADEKVQIVIPKAKVSSAFTLTMQPDGEPSVFDFNLDVFKAPESTDMVKIVRYQ